MGSIASAKNTQWRSSSLHGATTAKDWRPRLPSSVRTLTRPKTCRSRKWTASRTRPCAGDTRSTDIPRCISSKTAVPSKSTTEHAPSKTFASTSTRRPSDGDDDYAGDGAKREARQRGKGHQPNDRLRDERNVHLNNILEL